MSKKKAEMAATYGVGFAISICKHGLDIKTMRERTCRLFLPIIPSVPKVKEDVWELATTIDHCVFNTNRRGATLCCTSPFRYELRQKESLALSKPPAIFHDTYKLDV